MRIPRLVFTLSYLSSHDQEDWDYERSDYLGFMIEARMQHRQQPNRAIHRVLTLAGLRKGTFLSQVLNSP